MPQVLAASVTQQLPREVSLAFPERASQAGSQHKYRNLIPLIDKWEAK